LQLAGVSKASSSLVLGGGWQPSWALVSHAQRNRGRRRRSDGSGKRSNPTLETDQFFFLPEIDSFFYTGDRFSPGGQER